MAQTLEQRRSGHAWRKSGEGVEKYGKDYVNLAKGLPALIMGSGLMQVMAFLHQKGGGHHQTAGEHLRDWLGERFDVPRDFEKFMERMLDAEPREYQAVTTEAFAWLKWVRQMAAARQRGA